MRAMLLSGVVTPIDWPRYRAIIAKADSRYLALVPGAIADLVSSAEVRRTWQFIKVNGEAMVTSAPQWKRLKEELAAKVPRGLCPRRHRFTTCWTVVPARGSQ
ncbi:MAG TPA: hypothetical protein VIK11_02895 [Tepidiformaceae bacterium]